MANQRVTDLDPIVTLPDSGIIHVIDTTVTTQNAAGSSFKITKANLLKENTAAILLNTAKVGISTAQATAITNNTNKVGYTDALVTSATSVVLNTAKVGITPTQASAITTNSSKVGYTDALVALAPTVVANTAKVGITTAQATAISDNTANTSKVSINNDVASLANVRSLRYREETYSSNLDMVMQSSVGVYSWVNVFTIAFNVVNSLVTRFKNRVATDSGTFENQTALETFLGTITSTLTTVLAAMTPNAVKASKLYSVIPNTSAFDATVVRNTTATRFNSAMLLVTEAANIARISYLTIGGEGFILDEAQRTNIFLNSNEFTTATKTFSNLISVPNQTGSPDNTANATKIIANSTSGFHRLLTNMSFVNSTTYTFSIFAKKGEYNHIQIVPGSGAFGLVFANFDLLNGVVGSTTAGTPATIVLLANGYYRCSCTRTATASSITDISIALIQSSTAPRLEVFTGNDVNGIFIYGGQTEIGAAVSSYIPTVAAAVTRNADVITLAPPVGTVKITTTFSDNTTQVLTTIPATYTVPEGLIKSVNFNNTL